MPVIPLLACLLAVASPADPAALVDQLGDPDPAVRAEAERRLTELGAEAAEALAAAADDPRPAVRLAAQRLAWRAANELPDGLPRATRDAALRFLDADGRERARLAWELAELPGGPGVLGRSLAGEFDAQVAEPLQGRWAEALRPLLVAGLVDDARDVLEQATAADPDDHTAARALAVVRHVLDAEGGVGTPDPLLAARLERDPATLIALADERWAARDFENAISLYLTADDFDGLRAALDGGRDVRRSDDPASLALAAYAADAAGDAAAAGRLIGEAADRTRAGFPAGVDVAGVAMTIGHYDDDLRGRLRPGRDAVVPFDGDRRADEYERAVRARADDHAWLIGKGRLPTAEVEQRAELANLLASLGRDGEARRLLGELDGVALIDEPQRLTMLAHYRLDGPAGLARWVVAGAEPGLRARVAAGFPVADPALADEAAGFWDRLRTLDPADGPGVWWDRIAALLTGTADEGLVKAVADALPTAGAARLLRSQGLAEAAVALTTDADDPAALLERGRALAALGRFGEAAETFGAAASSEQADSFGVGAVGRAALATALRSRALAAAGDGEAARQAATLALLLPLDGPREAVAGELATHPDGRPAWKADADAALRHARIWAAVSSWNDIDWVTAHLRLAELHERRDDPAATRAALDRGAATLTDGVTAPAAYHLYLRERRTLLRARALLDAGEVEAAYELAAAVLAESRMGSDEAIGWVNRMPEPYATKLYDAQMTRLRADLKAYPDSAMVRNQAAWLTSRVSRDLDEARVWAEEAVALKPWETSYADTLAEVLLRQGEVKAAMRIFDELVEREPLIDLHYQRRAESVRWAEQQGLTE